jgi:transposase
LRPGPDGTRLDDRGFDDSHGKGIEAFLSMDKHVEQKRGDARGLPSDALERLRRKAVAAVESGTPQMQVAFMLGVSRRSVGEWVRAYRARGEESFRPARRGRRRGEQFALSEPQQEQVLRVILAGPPDRVALPWRLWTRRAVAELIHRDNGISLRTTTVGRYLQRWGFAATTDPREQLCMPDESMTVGGAVEPAPLLAEDLRVSWTRLRLPPGPDPAYALLAVTRRGVLHFLAGHRPFDLEALDDLRHRLRMQLARDVRIVVGSWPPEHVGLLHSWLSGDLDAVTPGVRI